MKRLLVMLGSLLPLAAALAGELSAAPAEARTAFPGSLAPVPAAAHDLTASVPVAAAERVSFQIALRLQPDGKVPEANYQSLVRWLQAQGLTVNAAAFPLHTEIETSGTVGQISKALATRFGRVEVGGRSWVSAVSTPSLPAALSASVIGINGLQPFAHLNKGAGFARPDGPR